MMALMNKKIGFKSLQENIDTSTSSGKLIFHIFSALAEFERDLIQERTQAGLKAFMIAMCLDHYKLDNRKSITNLPNDDEAIGIYVKCFKKLFEKYFDKKKVSAFESALREILEAKVTHYTTPKP